MKAAALVLPLLPRFVAARQETPALIERVRATIGPAPKEALQLEGRGQAHATTGPSSASDRRSLAIGGRKR
jgi:hypothetical protein